MSKRSHSLTGLALVSTLAFATPALANTGHPTPSSSSSQLQAQRGAQRVGLRTRLMRSQIALRIRANVRRLMRRTAGAGVIRQTIDNKDTIRQELSQALGHGGEVPDLEVLFVTPAVAGGIPGMNSGTETNPFGHLAVLFKRADGTRQAMNISGREKTRVVKYTADTDYLYGIAPDGEPIDGVEQGSALNRTILGAQIYKLSPEQRASIEQAYDRLQAAGADGSVAFNMMTPTLHNIMSGLQPGEANSQINCALGVSCGLRAASAADHTTMFPKQVFMNVLRTQRRLDSSNVKLVVYKQLPEGNHGVRTRGLHTPLRMFRGFNLARRADAVVEAVPGRDNALHGQVIVRNAGAR